MSSEVRSRQTACLANTQFELERQRQKILGQCSVQELELCEALGLSVVYLGSRLVLQAGVEGLGGGALVLVRQGIGKAELVPVKVGQLQGCCRLFVEGTCCFGALEQGKGRMGHA